MESSSVAEWDGEVDDERMEDAHLCDGMSSEESERIDVNLLDEEDEDDKCDSAPVVSNGRNKPVVDLSQRDDDSELIVDLSQDDDPSEQVGESHHQAAVERGPPSSPAVVRATGLHAALGEWLQAGLVTNMVNCTVPQHEEWGALRMRASPGAKKAAQGEVQRWKSEIRAAKKKLHDDAIRELEAFGHDDHESESLDAFVRQVQGPDGDRVRLCESSRDRSIVRKAEEQAQLSCIESMLSLIELERLRIEHKPTPAVIDSEDSQLHEVLVARVASEMDVYAEEFETRWTLAPAAERCQLLVETTSFWNAARFWLPSGCGSSPPASSSPFRSKEQSGCVGYMQFLLGDLVFCQADVVVGELQVLVGLAADLY